MTPYTTLSHAKIGLEITPLSARNNERGRHF